MSLPFAIDDDWPGVLRSLRDRGAHVVALTPTDDAADLEAFVGRGAVSGPLALLLGGEGDGLSVAALGLADDRVRIEIEPAVDSLNVATAAAIALHRIRAASSGVPRPGTLALM